MDALEQIRKFEEFLEKKYKKKLLKAISKGDKFLLVSFAKLSKFDPDLADELLERPEEVFKATELALESFDLPDAFKNFRIRFNELPKSQHIMIRNIRSKDIGKLVHIVGTIRQKSDVRPQVTSARFECPSCGHIITVLQLESNFKEPTKCGCGRRGKFHLISKNLVDAQRIVIEESHEDLGGGSQPKRLSFFLKEDLVSPLSDSRTNPGSKVMVNGVVKEIPLTNNAGTKLTRYDLIVEANYTEPVEETFEQINLNQEEEDKIIELSKDPKLFKKLVGSIAPSIYGHNKIKEAMLLQLMSGVRKTRTDGVVTRGDIHILLVGDPGSGKSQLLKRATVVAPKARYVSGKGVSGAGLTATVVKDEFLRGWALEAGTLVLANNGIACTTADSKFILENGTHMSFEELFSKETKNIIFPKFKILGLNNATNKIESFSIKRAFRKKTNKKIIELKTRTGRKIKITEDNELLICKNSKIVWSPIGKLKKGEYIAVPKNIPLLNPKEKYSKDFAYVAGLIASDGHIQSNSRQATSSFYNSDELLIKIFKEKMNELGYSYSKYIRKKGKISTIRGKIVISKKDAHMIYNSTKSFANKLIEFGVPKGNKSSKNVMEFKIFKYSKETISSFLKGYFDGDGSIRKKPYEVTFTTGLRANAVFIQTLLLRLGLISSVKKSTNSWHCDIKGISNCKSFFEIVGTLHHKKIARFEQLKTKEVKDRIDILPNHQELFKLIIKKNVWKLGKQFYKYFWNYTKKGVTPSKYKLFLLNILIENAELKKHISDDILWDKIVSLKEIKEDYVYDFTMKNTNNFVANNIIMHNCIDEMDKMSVEDRSAMHEALEQQTVSISKANVQATLMARTTVLAAANPKLGRFDPYGSLGEQINLPPALLNRFDLIFPVRDIPNKIKDEKLAKHILSLHKDPKKTDVEIDTKMMKNYIAYAKQRISPKLTDEAIEEIKNYYVEMRSKGITDDGKITAIPISARQLEALVRLAEASARTRLCGVVEIKDAQRSISLVHYCLQQVGMDTETGKFDIDRISTGITSSQRSKIVSIKEIIIDLENKLGKVIPIEEIIAEAKIKKIEESVVDDAIEKLKRNGDLFEPKRGFISRV